MAIDEAILEAVSNGESPPTMRFYAWQPPCLSIGIAQPITDVDTQRLTELGWDLVRRPTGGRAILHTDELTYAVIASGTNPHVAGGVLESYHKLSQGLMAGLRLLGLNVEIQPDLPMPKAQRSNPICFQVPSAYELTVDGKKLIGSAQVRRRGGVLQHGSLPLTGDITRICLALRFNDEASRQLASNRIKQRAATVETLLGREIRWQQGAEALREGFQNALGINLEAGSLSETERLHADQLITCRYTHPHWTERI